jgi:macrolide-specific efflux system membrane fusion protein
MRFPFLPFTLGLLSVGAVAGGVLAVGSPAAPATSERTVSVTRGVVQSVVSGSGNLAPAVTKELSFAASGTVTKVYAKAGEHVKTGALLARLDPAPAQVALAEAKATLADAQDTLDGLDATTTTTTTTADASSVAAAQAAVDGDALAVDDAQDTLAATVLRAPVPGTVSAVSIAAGDTVGSSSSSSSASSSSSDAAASATATAASATGAIELVQLSHLTMDVALGESDIGKVKVGQPATVTVNAASGAQVAAHVSALGVLSSSSSSSTTTSSAVSYPVTVTLDQAADGIRAGMSATADIVTSQASGLTVPSQAIQGSSVTVLSAGKRVTKRVQTGVVGDSVTQILSGLAAGDQLVVTSRAATTSGASTTTGGTRAAGGGGGLGGGAALGGGGGGLSGAGGPPAGFGAG